MSNKEAGSNGGELFAIEQQMTGFGICRDTGCIVDLAESMGLSKKEWVSLKVGRGSVSPTSLLSQDDIQALDDHFGINKD